MKKLNKILVSVFLTTAIIMLSTSVMAGPVSSGIGGSVTGGVIGDIAGGDDNAEAGAINGEGVGVTGGARRQQAEGKWDNYESTEWEQRRQYQYDLLREARRQRFEDRRYYPCRRPMIY